MKELSEAIERTEREMLVGYLHPGVVAPGSPAAKDLRLLIQAARQVIATSHKACLTEES